MSMSFNSQNAQTPKKRRRSLVSHCCYPISTFLASQIEDRPARNTDKHRYANNDLISGIKRQIAEIGAIPSDNDNSWTANVMVEECQFTAVDGARLYGVLCAKTQKSLNTASSAILIVDGTGGKLTADPDKLIQESSTPLNFAQQYLQPLFTTDGPDVVLLYEWRNYGKSRKTEYKNTLGFSECRDVLGALEALLIRYPHSLTCERLGVVGISAGSTAVVNAAARLRRNHVDDIELDSLRAKLPEKMGRLQQASFRWMYLDTFPVNYLDTVAKQVEPIHRKIARCVPCLLLPYCSPRELASRAFERILKRSHILGPEEKLDSQTGALVKQRTGSTDMQEETAARGSIDSSFARNSISSSFARSSANMSFASEMGREITGLFLNREQALKLAMKNPEGVPTRVTFLHCYEDPTFNFEDHRSKLLKLGIELKGYKSLDKKDVHACGAAADPSILASWCKLESTSRRRPSCVGVRDSA